jgi:CheY-like chemotaxis protein
MTPMHVLVLERDPERRDVVLAMLRAAGHQVAAAPDGAAAAT